MSGSTEEKISLRTAVIVAGGMGTRLGREDARPKPLRPLVGVPLIKRVMASAASAGIRKFVVVAGYRAELMKAELPGLVPRGCELTVVENPRYEEPNGISLLVAAETLTEPFALLMSDHIFSSERLRAAIERYDREPGCLLVVEGKDTFSGDLEDATLVTVRDGRIISIGKDLTGFDAVDTGMFILEPESVTRAIKEAGPSPSISDAMKVLAGGGELHALALKEGFWQDVDTAEDIKIAEAKLYGALTKETDGPLARLINRRVSVALSTRLWRIGVGPNTVTAFTFFLGVLAGLSFAQSGGVFWGLMGATLFQLQSIIDGVDGELARLLLKESRFGFWFDITVDNLTHMLVFGGIALGQISDGEPGPWGVLGVLAVLGVAASFAVMAPLLNPARSEESPDGSGMGGGRLKKAIEGVSRRDFTYLLFPAAIFGLLGEFLWLVTVGTWLYAAAVLFLRIRTTVAGRT